MLGQVALDVLSLVIGHSLSTMIYKLRELSATAVCVLRMSCSEKYVSPTMMTLDLEFRPAPACPPLCKRITNYSKWWTGLFQAWSTVLAPWNGHFWDTSQVSPPSIPGATSEAGLSGTLAGQLTLEQMAKGLFAFHTLALL